MFKDQLIRTMGGIRLSPVQQVRLDWLATERRVSHEQILFEILEKHLGAAVPQFSAADRERLEQEIRAIAKKFSKEPNSVKTDILANKAYRYHLKDAEAKSYRDYLTLTRSA